MSPRKKKASALRSYTQESLDKSLKEAATKKESKVKKKDSLPKIKVKAGLGRDPASDEEWLSNLEETYKKLRDRKAHTALITMSQFNFLLEMARE
jgi:hypothetical protein